MLNHTIKHYTLYEFEIKEIYLRISHRMNMHQLYVAVDFLTRQVENYYVCPINKKAGLYHGGKCNKRKEDSG